MNKTIGTKFACYVSFAETLQTWWKTLRAEVTKVPSYWFPASIFSTLVDVWVVRRRLAGGQKGRGKKGLGRMKMKMKTEGGVLPHIIIYMEEKICVQSACAQ